MANNNKNKGKRGEREVAARLSSVFGLNFCRVPNSGAFVGGMNSFRKQTLTATQSLLATGDLIVPDELKHISFEIKTYKDFSFGSLFTQNKLLDGWIQQAADCGKFWFLIFKINHLGEFVVYDNELFKLAGIILGSNYMIYRQKYTITSMDDFFTNNKQILLDLAKLSVDNCKNEADGKHSLSTANS